MTESIRDIAFVRLSAIGDVVHALPLVRSLRSAYPSARITWFIQRGPWELVQHHSDIDEFVLIDRDHLLRSWFQVRRKFARRKFDLVVTPHTAIKAGMVTAGLRSRRKVGFGGEAARELHSLFINEPVVVDGLVHQQEQMLRIADHLGIQRQLDAGLSPTEDERKSHPLPPTEGNRPTVAISLATSTPAKDWPADRFAELVRWLTTEQDCEVWIVGGCSDAEERAWATLKQHAAGPSLHDLRAWDLRKLAVLIDAADVFVGADSAPLHIAVALNTPSVALMGATDPARFGPVRFQQLMVDACTRESTGSPADRMASISVAEVSDRVDAALQIARPGRER